MHLPASCMCTSSDSVNLSTVVMAYLMTYSPFGHKVNFRHVTSRKLRVKKWRSVKAFYSSLLIVVGTIHNTAVPFESIALLSLLSSTSMTPCSIFSDVCFNVLLLMTSLAGR